MIFWIQLEFQFLIRVGADTMLINRLVYVTFAVLTLIFAFNYGGRVPYTLLYLFLGLPLFSLIYTAIIIQRFKYIQDIDSKFVVKGDHVNFVFSISNEDLIIYPYVKVTFFGEKTIFARQL
jgi:hypothetical protein